jgi:GEVED domain/Secretion system C-terminal sorting domain
MKKIILLFIVVFGSYLGNAQYCTTSLASSTGDEEILNFQISSINNTTNCSNGLFGNQCNGTGILNQYSNFTSCNAAPVFAGSTYTFSVLVGSCGGNFSSGVKVFMDFNGDGDFIDVGEEAFFSGVNVNIQCIPPTTVTGSITIPITANPGTTRVRIVNVEGGQSSSTSITPCGGYTWGETEDYNIMIIPPTPCSGMPQVGLINQVDTLKVCPTSPVQLCDTGGVIFSNIWYNWIKSTNGGITWDTITGANGLCYTIPAGTPSALYRFVGTCLNTYDIDTTNNAVYVSVINPTYANVPYTQNFENWINYCDIKDVPDDNHWSNAPSTGDESWRRNDEGATANWLGATNGAYIPVASSLAHSARFHSYFANSSGNFDLYLDLSSAIGNKDFLFDFKMPLGGNFLSVSLSNNGGSTFTTLANYSTVSNWVTQLITLTSNSPTAIIRFSCSSNNFNSDIGIDNIKILAPCTGTPNAGFIPDTVACANDSFSLVTLSGTLAAGLSYEWQSSGSSTGPWTTIGITTLNTIKTVINTPTFFRCIVTCIATGGSSTTPVQQTLINSFYYCYCANAATNNFDAFDMGCVELLKPVSPGNYITLINNVPLGPLDTFNNLNAVNGYTNFQFSLPVEKIYKDSLYEARLTSITQSSWGAFGSSVIYIDYNRNGIFDVNENVGGDAMGSVNEVNFQFTVPATAQSGITGMRVITTDVFSPASIFNACNPINSGEVEDYLVEIVLPQCSAPLDPGIAYISDTLLCAGYPIVVYDTNHTDINSYTGLTMQWQSSTNGVAWSDIAGANQDSLLTIVSQKTYYRLKLKCSTGPDSVYSNVNLVNMVPAFACYPASASFGGKLDTADNGYFTIGTYNFSSAGATGPHVGNPAAIRTRTDFTNLSTVELYADSTYEISFYNILRPYFHSDAKITFFIDYNNNGVYEIPSERIYTGLSDMLNFYLASSFKTIANPAFNIPTGMRLILNNNILPNNASDLGVGLYTSGETEDFLVKFIAKPLALKDVTNMQNVKIYPNPSSGLVFIDLEANALQNLNISVTTVTGAEVFNSSHKNVNGSFGTSLDLSALSKGVYMVKLKSEKGTVVQKITLQ